MIKYSEKLALGCSIILFGITPLEHVPALRLCLLVILAIAMLAATQWDGLSIVKELPFLFIWAIFCSLSYFWSANPEATLFHLKHDLYPPLVGFMALYLLGQINGSVWAVRNGILACATTNFIVALLGQYLGFKEI